MTISHSAAETMAFGRQLATTLQPGDVLALSGDLGAGKTCLVKGIAAGLGIPHEVTSPTFTLIHEYGGGRCPLAHIDLYRLETPRAAAKLRTKFFEIGRLIAKPGVFLDGQPLPEQGYDHFPQRR